MTSAITAVVLPTPDTYNRRPSIDMEGMVYRKLTANITGPDNRLYSCIRTPNNPPIIIAIIDADKEISICSHNNWRKKSERLINNDITSCITYTAFLLYVIKAIVYASYGKSHPIKHSIRIRLNHSP